MKDRIKQRSYTKHVEAIPLPPDDHIVKLSNLLLQQKTQKKQEQQYAAVKDILSLLGAGVALSAALLAPNSARAIKPLLRQSSHWDEWKHFNIAYLRRTLHRLEQQKIVEIQEDGDQSVIQLTSGGKRKILRYSLDNLEVVKPKSWDGKWRLVLYDVPISQRGLGDLVRQALRTIGFYPIQKSVYLFPYSCFDHIEFIREYYGLGNALQYMLVSHIEHDEAYKTYFNLS